MEIKNDKQSFVMLWQLLEHTRRLFKAKCKIFCIRRILQNWLPMRASDEFIMEVCSRCEQQGYDPLPLPSRHPRRHREFLRAFVSTYLNIGMRKVSLKALDRAYSEVFPDSTPININKQKQRNYED